MLTKPFIFQTFKNTGPPKLGTEHVYSHVADHFYWASNEVKQPLGEKWARQPILRKRL